MAYKDDIHDKTSEFIKNNNIQLLSHNPTDIYNKQINKLIKNSVEIIPNDQKKLLLKIDMNISAPKLPTSIY